MKTDFFTSLSDRHVPGVWKFTIQTGKDGIMSVSALFNLLQNKDQASKVVPPMVLKGTPAELDEGFFDSIERPVAETAGLFHNMNDYLKGLEEARKQSKMEQDKAKAKTLAKPAEPKDGIEVANEPKVSREGKRKIYEEAMKSISELAGNCKYSEALALLPPSTDYPEKTAELDKKRSDLERMKKQYEEALTLFNA